MKPYWVLIALGLFVSGCNVSRYLPRDERLFAGTKIEMKPDSGVTKAQSEELESQLEDLARPKPNKKLFGFPYKVWLYYLIGEPRRENDFRDWFRRKFGEPPVLASAKAVSSNQTVWTGYMENEGFFRSSVSGSLVEKDYWATAVYQVQVRPRYYIDTVGFLTDSTPVRKALGGTAEGTLLKKGDPYRFEVIKQEQERIGQILKQRGFYYFLPTYVAVLADSSTTRNRLKLYVALKPDMPQGAQVPYYMRNIYVYPNYNLSGGRVIIDTNRRQAYRFGKLQIVDSARIYKPKLFRDIISLRPGWRYSSVAQDLTLSRFINVGAFKFVRNRFVPSFQGDTAVLDVHYYLTPYPKKSVRMEIAGVTKSNSFSGSQLTVSWRNRNALRRSELLTVNLSGGIEFQIGAGSQSATNYRYSADVSLAFPRLVAPFRIKYDRRQTLPKTIVNAGYELIVRNQLYNLNSFRTTYSYAWRTSSKSEHSLQPFGVTYVHTSNYGDSLYARLSGPEFALYINQILSDQLILNSIYSYNFNSSPQNTSPYSFRFYGNIEPAGNLAGLIKRDTTEFGYKSIFDVPFAQYVRMDIDNRHYFRLAPGMTWANRIFAGVGIPYGNSDQLPFVKQYFVGGSNSLRAFRPRMVGPGSYSRNKDGEAFYFQDGGGDVKLEFNTELRPQINKLLQAALFLDVGNVWMFSDEDTYGPGSRFSKNFWKELAVGTGLGLRLDLSYFVLRADVAFPLRKPWLPDGQRWVADDIQFGNRSWRRENLILNVAVGYPF